MMSRKRPAEASPDTTRLTCNEDITDILDGKRSISARKTPYSYTHQLIDAVVLKQLIGSLPPQQREQVMKEIGCYSTTPKKKLWQLFSPTLSQQLAPSGKQVDNTDRWHAPSPEPPSVTKPSPCQLARGSYVMQYASQATKRQAASVLPSAPQMLKSPRPAVSSPRLCRAWQGTQAMKKLNPGVSVIGSSSKLHISVCH
jgi:hypothetical protein